MPGPAAAIPAPEPTNRPAPMTPPMAIIDRWRFLSPAWSPSCDCPPVGPLPGVPVGTGVVVGGCAPMCTVLRGSRMDPSH